MSGCCCPFSTNKQGISSLLSLWACGGKQRSCAIVCLGAAVVGAGWECGLAVGGCVLPSLSSIAESSANLPSASLRTGSCR